MELDICGGVLEVRLVVGGNLWMDLFGEDRLEWGGVLICVEILVCVGVEVELGISVGLEVELAED